MNRKIILASGIVLVVISAALVYAIHPTDDSRIDHISPTPQPIKTEATDTPNQTARGTYIDYSQEALMSTAGTKLLFFYAPWCPQCRQIEESIKRDGIPAGVTVLKVDYDSNQPLRASYGVTLQTTFVKVDDVGNKLASYTAYEEPSFSAVVRELLP